jgi:Holliday junction resolvase RusA-like endonuclease
MSLRIQLPIKALTQNTYYRKFRNRLIIGEKGREYKEKVTELTTGLPQITGKVGLDIHFYFKDRRKRDLDNMHKCFIDCIKNRLIEDDDRVYELSLHKYIGTGIDKIECHIYSLEDEVDS